MKVSMWTKLTMLAAGVIFLSSCGGATKLADLSSEEEAGEVVQESLESIDLAEMSEINGYLSPLQSSPAMIEPLAESGGEDPRVLVYLNPNKIRRRHHLLRAVEAPLHISHHLSKNYRDGNLECADVEETGDCEPSTIALGGECTRVFTIHPQGCTAVIWVNAATRVITITGKVTATVKVNDGVIEVTAIPENLKVEDELGRSLNYNGTVTRTITPTDGGHSSVLFTPGLTVEDSSGAVGTAEGTRTVDVVYGSSFSAHSEGHLTYTPPAEESPTVNIDLEINRNVNIEEGVKTIHIDEKVITNGEERTRNIDLTIEKIVSEGDVLKELVVSGTAEYSGPGGDLSIVFESVVLDLNCPRSPRGGTITITANNHTFKIEFREGDCSCKATVIWENGEKEVDLCEVAGDFTKKTR